MTAGISWGTPTKILDNKTAATTGTTSIGDCTEVDLESCFGVVGFSVQCTFNAAATLTGKLHVYVSYDGTNYGDTAAEVFNLELKDKGNPTEQHFWTPVCGRKMKVVVENTDSAQSITAITVWAHKQTYSAS